MYGKPIECLNQKFLSGHLTFTLYVPLAPQKDSLVDVHLAVVLLAHRNRHVDRPQEASVPPPVGLDVRLPQLHVGQAGPDIVLR